MDLAWFRDLVISVFGIATIIVVIFMAVLAFIAYRKIRPIIDSVKATTRSVENISTCVESEVIRPLSQLAAFVQGVRQVVGLFGSFRKKKGECKDE
jgi:hypothetical protein